MSDRRGLNKVQDAKLEGEKSLESSLQQPRPPDCSHSKTLFLKVGTLDQLFRLSDDLNKLESFVEV